MIENPSYGVWRITLDTLGTIGADAGKYLSEILDIEREESSVLSMSTAHVTYSDRYQNFVIVDEFGCQMFNGNRPLVFTTHVAATEHAERI